MQDRLKQFKASFSKAEIDHARAELGRWNELDTWTFREGLLLMAGIDPYHSDDLVFHETGLTSTPNPCWARITEAPGIGLDSSGMPRPTGYVLNIFQFELMGRLLSLWTSNRAHAMQDRHPPAYFRQWAESKGFDTFLGLAAPMTNQTTAPVLTDQTEAAEPASDKPAKPAAQIDRGWVLKRAALIKKHERQWSTINSDFQYASENGLSKAAKAPGHGDWFENDALNWARQRGKLREETAQQASSPATPFSGLVHRMKG